MAGSVKPSRVVARSTFSRRSTSTRLPVPRKLTSSSEKRVELAPPAWPQEAPTLSVQASRAAAGGAEGGADVDRPGAAGVALDRHLLAVPGDRPHGDVAQAAVGAQQPRR